ncbi:uncharacterized protein LOC134673103 [Cydia fagiglandana]|uniref:uncharacterized protein LOC134673103 n=1 Tax=Cydia fagiglandana TaxID=1458189 RepID=UPI002FEE2136
MAAGNLRLEVLCLLIAVVAVTNATNYFHEFGNFSRGEESFQKRGSIYSFSYKNWFEVPEMKNRLITGIKVIVSGGATPDVWYSRPWVYIYYYFPQITVSDYAIFAKSVPCRPCQRTLPNDASNGEDFIVDGEL